jgi:CNT family concentrative nucleoside transporter
VSLALQGLFGFFALHALAWAASENRRAIVWRPVIAGMALTFALAALFLKVPVFAEVFLMLNRAVEALERATQAGTSFVFGFLGGAPLPYEERPGSSSFVLALRALPLVIVVSALTSLLFYWRVLPWIVRLFARLLERTMGVGGAVGLSAAANVFVGMVEAPLFVRPYIARMTRSELFVMMSCGMATIAGTVMVLYATFIGSTVPGALGHILVASIIATPAAIAVSLLMVPPAPDERSTGGASADFAPSEATGSMDAITRGTLDGAALLVNIVAMLLVLVALVHLANAVLGLAPDVGDAPLTLQRLLGVAMAPLAWLAGVPWSEAPVAGQLLGTKTILNELLAYIDLGRLGDGALSPRSRLIMTYALCGFANLGSLGIMIGGLATMAPERRDEVVKLGAKTLVSGTLATLIAGATVGVLN